jgi:hypothetical protein
MHCRISACGNVTATRWATYCTKHRNSNRRHGHPDQEAVKKTTIAPYVDSVRQRILRNPTSEAWELIAQRWAVLVNHCSELVAAYGRGQPSQRNHRQAASAILRVSQQATQWQVIETCLAMFLHQDQQPRFYRSDRAFRFQLARRVHGLAETSVGAWFNAKTGKVTKVYRDMAQRTTELLGRYLADAFGVAGLQLARIERTKAQDTQQRTIKLHSAMEALT